MDSKANSLLTDENDIPYILIGAGGHAKVIVDILNEEKKKIAGFFDDNKSDFENLEYLGTTDDLLEKKAEYTGQYYFIIAIGSCSRRKAIYIKVNLTDDCYGTAIHPKSYISKNIKIAEGTVVMANVVVNSSTTIGKHSILNSGSVIEHDNDIGDFVHISPGCNLAGETSVGEGTHIGIGTNCIQQINIGSWCNVGAGSVILKDIPDNTLSYGVPAKIRKEGINCEL
ncbi:acetyltransferase [Candidatus Enterococcus ferrettii]|uniref:PglD N-terminal domain-containing protein n=1 Tax=Candidatus Enterococcus ferrettii TaxID=2815324 RepID=A0ABV0EWI8_9ENTE|nr:acetyltransferase [Enterococcus sp. 665A]MBO1342779.1 acetyltransferase [Enterococcus sp. 665A]